MPRKFLPYERSCRQRYRVKKLRKIVHKLTMVHSHTLNRAEFDSLVRHILKKSMGAKCMEMSKEKLLIECNLG